MLKLLDTFGVTLFIIISNQIKLNCMKKMRLSDETKCLNNSSSIQIDLTNFTWWMYYCLIYRPHLLIELKINLTEIFSSEYNKSND